MSAQDGGIKVSVFMLTYNHEASLSRALKSVFDQQHNFSFEVIIGDDRSTDGTRQIIADYQQKYPGVIKAILNRRNIGVSRNAINVFKACKGDYIAILDGDDYWTDTSKLKRQIDFLESNPDFVLSCHRYEKYLVEEERFDDDHAWPEFFVSNPDGFELNPSQFFTHWFTQPLTVVFRRVSLDIKEIDDYKNFKDVHLFFHLLNKGRGFVHGFFGAVYTIHSKGLWNGLTTYKKLRSDFIVLDELIKKNKNNKALQWAYADALIRLYNLSLSTYKYPGLSPEVIWIKYKKYLFERSSIGYLWKLIEEQNALIARMASAS